MKRKQFLQLSAAAALIPAIGFPATVSGQKVADDKKVLVDFNGDGLNLTPFAYANLLSQLTANNKIVADNYSLTGCVEELETKFAALLGKEVAIFMPTGTLANHLAIRTLAGLNKRAIVQQESHVYNDTGDSTQSLSNINLIPLGAGSATFTIDEVTDTVKRTESGRVASKIGVISIESPVRRRAGEVFDYEQMKKISGFAKENDIKMHLDGARIFLASAYSGTPVKEYASLFDTVYVSLYKYFNAASGAILAGPRQLISPMYHSRRMFGSGLHQAWPYAAVANHYVNGFEDRYAKAVVIAEDLIKLLQNNSHFEIHRVASGTNIFRITMKGIAAKTFVENLATNGIIVSIDSRLPDGLLLQVNESLLNTNAAELEKLFTKSLN